MNKLTSLLLITLLLPFATLADTLVLNDAKIKKMQVMMTAVIDSRHGFSRTYSGEVMVPNQQNQVVSVPQQGLVIALMVATGQEVKKGQVIAQLSSAEFVGLQGEYLQAKTKLSLAIKTASRDKALAEEGIVPQRRYLESQSMQVALQTETLQKKQSLRLAGMSEASINQLNSASKMQSIVSIVAPISGQVIAQHAKVGDRLDGGMPLYQIAQLNPLWVEINVPIEEAANLANGLKVAISKSKASGQIIAILRSVNKATQTLQVRAVINQGANALSLGQFVEVVMAIDTQTDSLQVPRSALVRNGNQSFIFKRIKNGFEIVPVTLMNEDSEYAYVKGELRDGDQIASKGLAALKGSWLGLGGE
jgi:RND family efflux transporter MFP subunit